MITTKHVRVAVVWTARWFLEVMVALAITGLIAAMLFGSGCAASTRVTPASTAIQQETESTPRTTTTKRITGFTPDGKPITEEVTVAEPGVVKSRVVGTATGAGAQATGDKLDQKIDSGAPTLNLPGVGKGSGGSVSGDVTASIAGVSVFIILGGLCVLGGVACFAMQLYPRAGIGLLAVGGCFIAVGIFPWLWWLLLAVGVVGVGLYVWAERNHKSMREAVRAVAAGIEDLPGEIKARAKEAIGNHADAKDKSAIKAVKRADELGGA